MEEWFKSEIKFKITDEKLTLGERSRVSESEKAGDGVAEDGDQPHRRELLIVEVDEGLDHKLVGVVAGNHTVIHDLVPSHIINLKVIAILKYTTRLKKNVSY